MTRQCNIWNIHKFSNWQHPKFVANPGDDPNCVEHGSKYPCGGLGDLRELHDWELLILIQHVQFILVEKIVMNMEFFMKPVG